MGSEPQHIANVDDVCFIITVMEHDYGNLDAYRGVVEVAAMTSLLSPLGLPRTQQIDRLLSSIRSAIGALDLP